MTSKHEVELPGGTCDDASGNETDPSPWNGLSHPDDFFGELRLLEQAPVRQHTPCCLRGGVSFIWDLRIHILTVVILRSSGNVFEKTLMPS